ncbi:hypothetical protein [uncultured Tateyamaria sp.]|uniref:hypothetical protein n=1 Tax=uncultured Tateyamaria sp. TaxID=455651 RepID=UPI00261C6A34|nr:hypothetical protein [uncultured Tateyamaria sp.]
MIRVVRNQLFPYRRDVPQELVGYGLFIDVDAPWRGHLTHRLDIDAPESADPLCCYRRTVIFYEQPLRVEEDGNWAEYGRVETAVMLDDVIETEHGVYLVHSGKVRWCGDHWGMVWRLRRVEEAVPA